MTHSTRRQSGDKVPSREPNYTRTTPARKKPPFPLWLHSGTGQWAKSIRRRRYYFGTDRDAALAEYVRVKDDLEAGRIPQPPDGDRLTLLRAVNAFLTHKKHLVETGELSSRSFGLYYTTCERLLEHLGKTVFVEQIRPDDLLRYRQRMGETLGSQSLANEVTRVRSVFLFAFENGLIDRPVRFGTFKRPSKSVMRRQRAARPPRMFEPDELRRIIDAASPGLRAMIFLGVNCGFGPTDVATLPTSAVDLAGGWVDYPRPKTGVARRCPLWPETIAALRAVMDGRQDAHPVVFITTKLGRPWTNGSRGPNGITHEMRKLLDKLGLYRPGLSFYTLRHCHQTIGDETGDYLAVRRIMGHADSSISDAYRERFPDDRLRRVADHVRAWLYGEGVAR